MPPKHKNKSANPRDRRHENGLAPPVKQVKKQKSDIHINGNATRPSPISSAPPTSLPVGESSGLLRPDDPSTDATNSSAAMQAQSTPLLAAIEPDSTSLYSASLATPISSVSGAGPTPTTPRNQDAAEHQFSRGRATSSTDAPSTVIKELSVFDVIAILLVLMQLPYSVLGMIQLCFAFLTFGSPPTGWSVSSIWQDMLLSHGGSPSIFTMLIMDAICGIGLTIPWGSKDFALDLAQAVIAVSLGGGTSGRYGKTQSLLCFVIVAIHHFLGQKYWSFRYHTLSGLCWLWNIAISSTSLGPLEPEDILDGLEFSPDTNRNWLRRMLELHILSQGILRILRRMIIHSGSVRRGVSDPAYIPPGSPIISVNPVVLDGGRNSSSDGRQPGPSPAGREGGREKSFTLAKKKKKQATFVRSQQPFWAAIANTKVTVLKEYEQSKASQDTISAAPGSAGHLHNTNGQYISCPVWITNVSDTEVRFKAFYSPLDGLADNEVGSPIEPNALPSISIRVNGADWSSTSIDKDGSQWEQTLLRGHIFGLTSLTNYVIEFRDSLHDLVIHSVTLLTKPDSTLDHAPVEGSFRPSSPISTLKKSIAAAESNLTDHRNRLKKNKRARQNAITTLRKDINKVESHLTSTGNNDEKQLKRSAQYTQSIKQTDAATGDLVQQVQDLGDVPQSQREAAAASKGQWKTRKHEHGAMREYLDKIKADSAKQLTAARSDIASLQQKQERLTSRLSKLSTQRENLLAANAQDAQDQKRRDQTRVSEMARAHDEERRLKAQLRNYDVQSSNVKEQNLQIEQQLHFLEHGYVGAEYGVPQTPETTFSSMALGENRPPPGLGALPPFQQPIGTPPVHSRRGSLFKQSRVRSSSMLSAISGMTDDQIDSPPSQPLNGVHSGPAAMHATAGESSVGSSGGSQRPGSSSRPNTTSPAPLKLSPIGAEIGRNTSRNAKT